MRLLLLVLLLAFVCVQVQAADQPACRGAYIVPYIAFSNLSTLRGHLDYLQGLGVNAVFVDVLFRGFVLYPGSSYLPTYPGYPHGWDPLAAVVQEAHFRGMEVYAWAEYGFFSFFNYSGWLSDDPTVTDPALGTHTLAGAGGLFRSHPDWWAYDRYLNYARYEPAHGVYFFIFNLIHPDVQSFYMNLYSEMLQRYDIDSLVLDRIRYPNADYSFDGYTRGLYMAETGGPDPINLDPYDPNWLSWKKAKLSDFVHRLRERLREVKPTISLMANVTTFGDIDNKCQDYPTWAERGYVDILAPMNYTSSLNGWLYELELERSAAPSGYCFIEGVNAAGTDAGTVGQMLSQGAAEGVGLFLWYSNALTGAENQIGSKWSTPVPIPHPPIVHLVEPRGGQILSGDVPVRWQTYDRDGGAHTIDVAISADGGSSWTTIASGEPNDGSYTWRTSDFPSGTNYLVRVRASDGRFTNTDQSDGACVLVRDVRPLSYARLLPDGSVVKIEHVIATSGLGDFDGRIYVETEDRCSGLAVATDCAVPRGARVTVAGSMSTMGGERVLSNAIVLVEGIAAVPRPVGMVNRCVAGGDCGPMVRGAAGAVGLNNVGILIRTWGRVVELGADYFVIDDSSGAPVRASLVDLAPGNHVTMPQIDRRAVVTGISGLEYRNGMFVRVIRPRCEGDITPL